MPQYTFLCGVCNLQFKKRLGMGDHPNHKCPSCKGMAPRYLEGFGFDFAETSATRQANSGVTKHDYPTADQAVGSSAAKRWEVMHSRMLAKDRFRQETGAVALARRDKLEGTQTVSEYTPLGQAEFDARKKQEAKFREKASQAGLEQPSKAMPSKNVT